MPTQDLRLLQTTNHNNYINYNLSSLINSELYKAGLIDPIEMYLPEIDAHKFRSMLAVGKVDLSRIKDKERNMNYE